MIIKTQQTDENAGHFTTQSGTGGLLVTFTLHLVIKQTLLSRAIYRKYRDIPHRGK